MSEREDILRKVRALLNRTPENGCTEAEAAAAANAAARILDKHGLSAEAVESVSPDGMSERSAGTVPMDDAIWSMLRPLKRFCTVEAFMSHAPGAKKATIMFFGAAEDVEVAIHLMKVIRAAIKREGRAYLQACGKTNPKQRRLAARSFRIGMARRLGEKLEDMIELRDASRPTGQALVLVKSAKVKDAFDQAHDLDEPPKQRGIDVDPMAAMHGAIAGERTS